MFQIFYMSFANEVDCVQSILFVDNVMFAFRHLKRTHLRAVVHVLSNCGIFVNVATPSESSFRAFRLF